MTAARPATAEPAGAPTAPPSARTPSVELLRVADLTLIWGIASIVLGWTFIVPLIAFCWFVVTSNTAKKEELAVPGKATLGLFFVLCFGGFQMLVVVLRVLTSR